MSLKTADPKVLEGLKILKSKVPDDGYLAHIYKDDSGRKVTKHTYDVYDAFVFNSKEHATWHLNRYGGSISDWEIIDYQKKQLNENSRPCQIPK